jgi:spore germination protein
VFSENGKISGRQFYRNYAISIISLSALIVPLFSGQANLCSIGTGILLLGIYLWMTVRIPCPKSRMLRFVSFSHYWLLGTVVAHMTGRLIQEFLLKGTSLALILFWFYLICYYQLYKGLECRVRVGEILFLFFVVMILLLLGLTMGEAQPVRLRKLSFAPDSNQLRQGYELFVWLGAVQSLWYRKGHTLKKEDYPKITAIIWGTGAAAVVFLRLFTLGIYGSAGHRDLSFPLASAMTLAHLPGNVIGRLDAVFVLVWVMGLFLLGSTLFAPLEAEEPDLHRKVLLAAGMAVSFVLALFPQGIEWCWKFLCYVSMPLQLILLLWRGTRKKLLLLLLPIIFLTGCGRQELEEQSLVLALGVDSGEEHSFCMTLGFGATNEEGQMDSFITEGDTLTEVTESYQAYYGKKLDFNHLKNIYLSEQLLLDDELESLLEEFQTDSTYSRGTGVYAVQGNAGEEAVKVEQPEKGVPLHRILNAYYNEESCEIPEVQSDGMYKGSIFWPQ